MQREAIHAGLFLEELFFHLFLHLAPCFNSGQRLNNISNHSHLRWESIYQRTALHILCKHYINTRSDAPPATCRLSTAALNEGSANPAYPLGKYSACGRKRCTAQPLGLLLQTMGLDTPRACIAAGCFNALLPVKGPLLEARVQQRDQPGGDKCCSTPNHPRLR
jgi:hypothetical protein